MVVGVDRAQVAANHDLGRVDLTEARRVVVGQQLCPLSLS